MHYDALFKSCIAALNRRQLRWKLIREEEKTATEYTLSFGNGGITEEGRGCFFHGIQELEAFLAGIDPGTTVTDNFGSLADEVMIREFTGRDVCRTRYREHGKTAARPYSLP